MQEANKIEPEEDFPQESAEVQPDSVESDPETDLLESPSQEGDDFYERVEIVADQRQSPIRLDKYLIDRLAAISRNKLQITIRAGGVLVDEKPVKPNYKVRPGNRINVILTRSFDDDQKIEPQDIPLNIVYEDDDLMIINKPFGMAVHPGVGIPNGTLVNAVAWHLKDEIDRAPLGTNDYTRAGIVHRIDKDTTGLMVVAKNTETLTNLASQFFYHTIERRYWTLVWGDVEEESGTIVSNIGRNPHDRRQFMVFPDGEDGKHAVTHWRVLDRFYYVTLVECRLETGRTHQIRVHMKSIGHTLFGDVRYGGNQILKGTIHSKYRQFVENNFGLLPRQALHAKVLGFTHPRTGERMRFESELPVDMQTVIDRWREYVNSRKALL
jgi:23S rRNA pseudouridine1911/1915/1917 synthase